MEWRLPLLVISTLCGLAFSATEMVNRSTPASYAACTRSVSRLSPRNSCRLNTPRGRSAAIISVPLAARTGRSAFHGEHVALNVEVDVFSFHPWQVKLHNELVPIAPGIHRQGRWARGGAEDLLGEPVKLTEGIGAHQHLHHSPACCALQWGRQSHNLARSP